MDLREALSNGELPARRGVLAPNVSDNMALDKAIALLRKNGERVVKELPGVIADPTELGCDRCMVFESGAWQVKSI